MDGSTCAEPSDFDSFKTFDYFNPTINVYGDRRKDYASNTRATLMEYVTSISTQTDNAFYNEFYNTMIEVGIESRFTAVSLQAGAIYSIPVLDTSSEVIVTPEDTYISVSGLKLLGTQGVFFGVANNENLALSSQVQIRQGLNSTNSAVSSNNAVYNNASVTLTFSDLKPDTDYMIYYYAINGERTQYARATEVIYLQTKTKPARTILGGAILEVKFMFMFILSVFLFFLV